MFLGYIMKKLGARRIFLLSALVTSVFNTTFFAVDLVSSGNLFLALSVTLICLTSLGDAGIFCSNYVLAAQQSKKLRKRGFTVVTVLKLAGHRCVAGLRSHYSTGL